METMKKCHRKTTMNCQTKKHGDEPSQCATRWQISQTNMFDYYWMDQVIFHTSSRHCLPLQNISFLWRLSNCFDNLFHWKQSVWLCDSRTMRNRGGQIFRKWEIRKDMKQMFKTDKQADTNKMRTLQHDDYSDCLLNVESKTSFFVHVVGKDVVTRTKSGGRREKLPVPGGDRHTRYVWATNTSIFAGLHVRLSPIMTPDHNDKCGSHNTTRFRGRKGRVQRVQMVEGGTRRCPVWELWEL